MQITQQHLSDTKVKLTIAVDAPVLAAAKESALMRMSRSVKVDGFRPGKAPLGVIEKQIDPAQLESEILEQIINQQYVGAIDQEKLRPVAQPEVSISKFVPYTTLEFTAEVEVVGKVSLGDYKKIKVAKKPVAIAAKDVDEVLENLRTRGAEKKDVDRPAKLGDQATIDFKGTDAKTGDAIAGADGKDYPLLLGSNSFIPGFEEALVGVKPKGKAEFTLTFPKDYGSAALQNKKVTFAVTVNSVQELVSPKLDDAFATTIGPFKSLAELKADIKKQLTLEREQEAQRAVENEILETLANKSQVAIPQPLIESEIDRIEEEEKRNIVYRGQTWQEHLDEEGVTAEAHRDKQRPAAELRVKAGLILAEVAEKEGLTVSKDELEVRLKLLKGQYTDPSMHAELDTVDARREIASRLLSEKTIAKLVSYATAK